MISGPPRICVCGHDESEHEHWRQGTDCGRCGWRRCCGFEPPSARPPVSPELRRLLAVTVGIPLSIVTVAAVASWAGDGTAPIAAAAVLAIAGGLCTWWLIRPPPQRRGGLNL